MKKLLIVVAMIAIAVGLIGYLYHDWKQELDANIEFMESKDDFTPEEVDRLWHFKNENSTNQRFDELYERKIKPLPGVR